MPLPPEQQILVAELLAQQIKVPPDQLVGNIHLKLELSGNNELIPKMIFSFPRYRAEKSLVE